jgi:hypothetical protein
MTAEAGPTLLIPQKAAIALMIRRTLCRLLSFRRNRSFTAESVARLPRQDKEKYPGRARTKRAHGIVCDENHCPV